MRRKGNAVLRKGSGFVVILLDSSVFLCYREKVFVGRRQLTHPDFLFFSMTKRQGAVWEVWFKVADVALKT